MGNANSTKLQQERLPLLPGKEQLPPPPPPLPQPQPQPESDDHFTCEICGEHMLSSNKFRNDDLCVHPFCVCCITDYVQFRIEKDGVVEIECPGLNCDQFLDPIFCRDRELITPTLFDKWCDLLCQRSVSKLDHCYCPNQQCSAVVLNECGGVVKRSVCPNCKELFCFLCKLPWHAGFRCKEQGYRDDVSLFLNWDQNDVASSDLAKRYKWMRCPQCRHCVEVDRYNCHRAKCRFSLSLPLSVLPYMNV